MRWKWIAAALAVVLPPAGAQASVAPLTPEGRVIMQKREAFETHARTSLGDHGLIEKLRDWRRNWGFIIVGKEGAKAAPRVLVKDEYGWYELRRGMTRRLSPNLGRELNRLLTSGAIWSEQPYNWGAACRGTPRLFVVAHAGKDQFGRLGCGREGLGARAARIAETLSVPPRGSSAILPMRELRREDRLLEGPDISTTDILERLSEKTYAWDRKTLAGFVDPYAEDAVIEGPQGTFRGRKAIVDWARYLQDWAAPYSETPSRLALHQAAMTAQTSPKVRYTTHELRWEQEGKPVRQTYSTMWRNNGGLWQIAHERISEVKPVTDGRPL